MCEARRDLRPTLASQHGGRVPGADKAPAPRDIYCRSAAGVKGADRLVLGGGFALQRTAIDVLKNNREKAEVPALEMGAEEAEPVGVMPLRVQSARIDN